MKGAEALGWPANWYRARDLAANPEWPDAARTWIAPAFTQPETPVHAFWAENGAEGFLLVYHPAGAEVGFWLSPALRGHGFGGALLRRAADQITPRPGCPLMATIDIGNVAAHRTAQTAGFRIMAKQPRKIVFCRYPKGPYST